MEERYDLGDSKRSVRELYPVLLDAHGNVIDGYHRLRADPDWRTETLGHIKTPTQLVLARIIANTHRRSVSREEREEQINELARCLLDVENVPREELIPSIADLTTFSDKYIRELLSDEYKTRPRIGGAATHKRVELSSTQKRVGLSPNQREEFDEALQSLGIVVPRGEPGPPAVDAYSEEEAPATIDSYIAEYFSRYKRPDEEFLVWDLQRRYDVSEEEAKRHLKEFKELKEPQPKPKEPTYEPQQRPICRCPLCGRDGADKFLILANFVEDATMAQMTLFDFVTEAFKR